MRRQLISDPRFEKGFLVKGQQDGDNTVIGKLFAREEPPDWTLAQWYCGWFRRENGTFPRSHNLIFGRQREENGVRSVETASERVVLSNGSLTLSVDGSKEFLAPRKAGEPWPHLLLEYEIADGPRLSSLSELGFVFDFTLLACEDRTGRAEEGLHTAQFVWYVRLADTEPDSPGFGDFIWFGMNAFDRRYPFPALYASEDGGKEIDTGAFIYVPDAREYYRTPTSVGRRQHVERDLLPLFRAAYAEARKRGYLSRTRWSDLAPTGGNFGWEITGSFDAEMRVDEFGLIAEGGKEK